MQIKIYVTCFMKGRKGNETELDLQQGLLKRMEMLIAGTFLCFFVLFATLDFY